jgi:phosphopantetheine--protein transferase-like protein
MIGIDLVYIPEFKQQLEIGGNLLINKAFDQSEIKNQTIEHLAGIWAAKEAVIKASEVAPKKMADILISYDTLNKPYAKLGSHKYAISISHHGDYAIAVVYRLES